MAPACWDRSRRSLSSEGKPRSHEGFALRPSRSGLHDSARLAEELLEAPLPPEAAAGLAGDPVVTALALPICERILNPGSRSFPFSERLRFDLGVRERRRDRIAYGLDRLLTPNERDLPATPRPLRLLRVPWRLFRLARRYLLSPSRGRAFLLDSGEKGDSSDG